MSLGEQQTNEIEFWLSESVKDRAIQDDFDLTDKLLSQTGHFGKLYECKPRGTNQSMCLKVIPKNKERKVFVNDASHLLKLKHQNLIRLREIFEDRNNIYLVSDYHSGGEVLAGVAKRSSFTERDAAKILGQILEGLRYLHDEEGLIHGNLKPSNFVFENNEEDAIVKIADVASYAVLGRELLKQSVISTPEFCAPEVIKKESCDYSSDMWSFGAFAYLLLCGDLPFYSEDKELLYKLIFKGIYRTDVENYDIISINAKDFISKFLNIDAKKRTSAREALRNNWVLGKATRNENLESCLASLLNLTMYEYVIKNNDSIIDDEKQLESDEANLEI